MILYLDQDSEKKARAALVRRFAHVSLALRLVRVGNNRFLCQDPVTGNAIEFTLCDVVGGMKRNRRLRVTMVYDASASPDPMQATND